MSSATVRILESATLDGQSKVDRENGVILGVKILGEKSRNAPPNNNVYPKHVREKAVPVIEGARVYVNHRRSKDGGRQAATDPVERGYEEQIGDILNVRESGDGLRGDFHFNPEHPLAKQVMWDAEKAPRRFAFSINALVSRTRGNGEYVVEELVRCDSVDLVCKGGTVKSAFESYLPGTLIPASEALTLVTPEKHPRTLALLQEMVRGGQGDYGQPVPGEGEGEQELADALAAAVVAVMRDTSLKWAQKRKKIDGLLDALEGTMSEAKKPDEGKKAEESAKLEEAHKAELTRVNESWQLKLKARDLAAEAGVVPTKTLLKALDACGTEAEIKEVLEDFKATTSASPAKHNPPRSAPPPAPRGDYKKPESRAELLQRIKG